MGDAANIGTNVPHGAAERRAAPGAFGGLLLAVAGLPVEEEMVRVGIGWYNLRKAPVPDPVA